MRKTRLALRTAAQVFDRGRRAVVLEFDPQQPEFIALRLSGCRQRIAANAGDIYTLLLQRQIEAERRAKKTNRRGRA